MRGAAVWCKTLAVPTACVCVNVSRHSMAVSTATQQLTCVATYHAAHDTVIPLRC